MKRTLKRIRRYKYFFIFLIVLSCSPRLSVDKDYTYEGTFFLLRNFVCDDMIIDRCYLVPYSDGKLKFEKGVVEFCSSDFEKVNKLCCYCNSNFMTDDQNLCSDLEKDLYSVNESVLVDNEILQYTRKLKINVKYRGYTKIDKGCDKKINVKLFTALKISR